MEERKQKKLQRLELQQIEEINRQQKSAKDNFASDFCNCLKDNLLFVTLDALARVQEKSATLEEVNDELQRKQEKLHGKLDAQVMKNRDLQ